MGADIDADPFGDWRHFGEKIDEVALQSVTADTGIGLQVRPKLRQAVAIGGARKARTDVARQGEAPLLRHVAEAPTSRLACRYVVVFGGARPLQQMEVEGNEVDPVEAHRLGAVTGSPAQVGARPIEHRHEIVADGADAGRCQAAQRFLPVGNVLAPRAGLRLDAFRHRDAFDDLPLEAAVADLLLPLLDLLDRPDVTGRDMMQRTDDTVRAGLRRVPNAYPIHRSEPAPRMSHVNSFRAG